MRSHALAILVPLLPKYLDEVSWGPLAVCLSAGIAAENFKKLHGFDHGITTSIPDQDPVRINVVIVPYLLERTVEQELEEQVRLFIGRHLGSQCGNRGLQFKNWTDAVTPIKGIAIHCDHMIRDAAMERPRLWASVLAVAWAVKGGSWRSFRGWVHTASGRPWRSVGHGSRLSSPLSSEYILLRRLHMKEPNGYAWIEHIQV